MTTKKTSVEITPPPSYFVIEQQLADIAEQQKQLAATLRIARGTREGMTPLVAPEAPTLTARIETLVRTKPHTIQELSKALREPAGSITTAMKDLRKQLSNVGTDMEPRWFYMVGDEAPTGQVNEAIKALIADRPMTFTELGLATNVRPGRVSGALVALQREGERIANLGTNARGRWFLVPDGIKLARLKSR